MTEKTKISKVMKEYEAFFSSGKRAVCFSSNGDFFFYQLSDTKRYYDTFVKFSTADELVSIIRTFMIDALEDNISCAGDDLFFSMQEINVKEYDLARFDYQTQLLRLLDAFEVIKRQTKILMDSFGEFCCASPCNVGSFYL